MSKSKDAAFKNIIRSRENELYWRKREALIKLLDEHEDHLDALAMRTFGNTRFTGYEITKRRVALELLNDALTEESFRLIRTEMRELAYLTDRRHTEEYAFDVVLGWLIEGFVLDQLKNGLPPSVDIVRAGVGSALSFQSKPGTINASPDCEITANGRTIRLDLYADHKGTWQKNRAVDLKQGKVTHLRKGKVDYVLGIDLLNGGFHLISKSSLRHGNMRQNPGMGGLTTLRIPLTRKMSIAAVSAKLESRLGVE